MWRKLLGTVWRGAPKSARRWSVWLTQPRFTVTVGAVVRDERGRVLLFNHVFRKGSGWGIPGGFIGKGENPEDALRRELCEEAGLQLDEIEIAFSRTHRRPQQVEIIYRCRARADGARGQSIEIESTGWFELDKLPPELARDQHRIIQRALGDDAGRGK
ncbi:MAG TPA: NUDIX domain-containing protein [Pyrinomonadaceae bacterium]|nr:NUDIX domain-containing protein [Pyrinomonadaceae bacterium]